MAKKIVEYQCLLISPGDVSAERDAVEEVVGKWNAQVGVALDARIQIVRWETHSIPDLSGPPQSVLNRQIVDGCDFAIAIFWARLGTPTEEHQSGSLEEIQRLRGRGARVLTYFNTAAVSQDRLVDDQFRRLQEFKATLLKEGLLGEFTDVAHLRELVLLHVTGVASGLLERDRGQRSPAETTPAVLTAPRPDLRVLVGTVLLIPSSGRQQYIRVTVQNHSPVLVFVSSVAVATKGGIMLWPPRDAVTGEDQTRRALRPGESYSMVLDGYSLVKDRPLSDIECAVVSDDIGRQYRSSESDMQRALRDFVPKGE